MAWIPRYHHVSQLHSSAQGLSGWNDCWEACLARYLRERNPKISNKDDWALINTISLIARDAPDAPTNTETTLEGAAKSLHAYGIAQQWTTNYQQALAAPWSICLVNGALLTPAQYPSTWFGTEATCANHFILWLPYWQGSADWFNDPLAYTYGQRDCRYDLQSVAAAFAGAYLLPNTDNGEAQSSAISTLASSSHASR